MVMVVFIMVVIFIIVRAMVATVIGVTVAPSIPIVSAIFIIISAVMFTPKRKGSEE